MNKSNKLLSDIVSFRTYAKYLSHLGRRETLEETINRNMMMHLDRFPKLSKDIIKAYKQIHNLGTMPSMRSMQFGGEAILKNNIRTYNCSYLHLSYERAFAETLYLLLCGTGVGYSVQKRHISRLSSIKKPKEETVHVVHDSIEGWAEALNALMSAYFYRGIRPVFDFSQIRPKGSYLVTTGARAPGPEPLKNMLKVVESKLLTAVGRKLTSLEVHDIVCISADCVLAGGIRRAALICLFDRDDNEMLTCKSGSWWEKHPYRARANNSALLPRNEVSKKEFKQLFYTCIESKAGEPAFSWTNDPEMGTNPSLRAGTKVLTANGVFPIEQLENKTFKVVNLNGQLSDAKCWLSGKNKQLYKIKLKSGKEYYATPEHKWPVLKNEEWIKTESKDLKSGDRLPVVQLKSLFESDFGTRDDGFAVGWITGDGWITERKDTGKIQVGFCTSKKDEYIYAKMMGYINEITGSEPEGMNRTSTFEFNTTGKTLIDHLFSLGLQHKSKGISKIIWSKTSENFRKGFIDGLFSSDSHVEANKNYRISLSSAHGKLIEDVADLLGFYGIKTTTKYKQIDNPKFPNGKKYDRQYEIYTLRITGIESVKLFASIFNLSNVDKQQRIDSIIQKNSHLEGSSSKNNESIEVDSVELSDVKEDVWDISVMDTTHCFKIEQCITGNCHEISLNSNQMCNLTTTNLTGIKSDKDLHNRVYAASLLGTLQASYTDFPYLSDNWKETTEREALLGCSFTGIADATSLTASQLKEMASLAVSVNQGYAKKIGINPSARITAVKPEGSASCVVGASSGVHARHADFYLRRVRMNKDDSLARYLVSEIPELVEDDVFSPTGIVVTIPQQSPPGAIVRDKESAKSLLERVLFYHRNWILPGHVSGANTHNVSCTINYKPEEIEELFELMWENRNNYNGISLLPFDGGTYQQAPFETCDQATFDKYEQMVKNVDLTRVIELEDLTDRVGEIACAGGACDIDFSKPKK